MLKDLRHAVRLLWQARGWTTIVVLSLALGIGANTAIFSAVNARLLISLPVQEPEELVRFRYAGRNDMVTSSSGYGFLSKTTDGKDVRATFSYPMYQQFVADNKTMTDLLRLRAVRPGERLRRWPVGDRECVHLIGQLLPATGRDRPHRPDHPAGGRPAHRDAGRGHQLQVLAFSVRHRPRGRRQDDQGQQRADHDCRRDLAALFRHTAACRQPAGHFPAALPRCTAHHRPPVDRIRPG